MIKEKQITILFYRFYKYYHHNIHSYYGTIIKYYYNTKGKYDFYKYKIKEL